MDERDLISDIGSFYNSPKKIVRYSFPWKTETLSGDGCDSPRAWQDEVLGEIESHLKNIDTRYTPLRIAVSSGHGVGKSALISWILHWGMSTCPDCKCVVTANTGTQLDTKTWPEIQKWFNLAINSHWFDIAATSISCRDKKHSKQWRVDAIPWNDQRPEAFAGLHNQGKRIIVVYDESSSIPDKIWEVTEGALTDKNTEIIWIAFGNPTRNTGRFAECFGKYKHRWITKQIDSRTVPGTNKNQIQQWIDDYGEDSDFVRVRVRGVFPRSGTCQFISNEDVGRCLGYQADGYLNDPKILAVDVARFGDDQTVFCIRQRTKVYALLKYRGLDTQQVAGRIAEVYKEVSGIETVIIDGGGLGSGVVDRTRQLIPPFRVVDGNFGSEAIDKTTYFNCRAELWGLMRDSIRSGLDLPDDTELLGDLTAVEYGFSNKNQIQLEKKEDMKSRGLSSPDSGDALALTYLTPMKRVFPNVSESMFLIFKIDWLKVQRDGVIYGSIYQDEIGAVAFVSAVYDTSENMLLVRSAETYDQFNASVIGDRAINMLRLRGTEPVTIVCNDIFNGRGDCILKTPSSILQEYFTKKEMNRSSPITPISYYERGSISMFNKMVFDGDVLVHRSLTDLSVEMSRWSYRGKDTQPGHLQCRALLYILSDIRARAIAKKEQKERKEYTHIIGGDPDKKEVQNWMIA